MRSEIVGVVIVITHWQWHCTFSLQTLFEILRALRNQSLILKRSNEISMQYDEYDFSAFVLA